ncbi:MAG TPA: (2Fe-2S)-binding protein [Vicinamibacterales bacterium]|nr:(2Fe-2S)-binding protein [Vicinamibacterales bacterium]
MPATDDDACAGASGLRIGGASRGRRVGFLFDGRPVSAYEGESIAGALACAGIRTLRTSPRSGAPRGMFCMMGSCQECVVRIDGRIALSCQEPVREGLDVRSGTIGNTR